MWADGVATDPYLLGAPRTGFLLGVVAHECCVHAKDGIRVQPVSQGDCGFHGLDVAHDGGRVALLGTSEFGQVGPREWGMHWNAVPWYLGVRGKIAAAKAHDVERGREWLLRLVDLLPDLRLVLCLGNAARDAVAPPQVQLVTRGLTVLNAPHPSQRVYNVTKGTARDSVHAMFDEAKKLASTTPTTPASGSTEP